MKFDTILQHGRSLKSFKAWRTKNLDGHLCAIRTTGVDRKKCNFCFLYIEKKTIVTNEK